MGELRRDVRAVFERQQAALGDLPGARERVMRAALVPPPAAARQPRRLVAGVTAVLLAAGLVGALLLVRDAGRARQPAPAATPSPSPTPLVRPLSVLPAVPVVMFHDPLDPTQVDGITWDGSTAGRVGPATATARLDQDPTGTLYGAGDLDVRDRSGALAGTLESGVVSRTWADDGRHYCWIDPVPAVPPSQPVPAILQLRALGERPQPVTQVGTEARGSGIEVIACSIRADRAVVSQGYARGAVAAHVSVVRLSTGVVLWSREFPSGDAGQDQVVASPDGRYVAVAAASATTIYDTEGGVTGHVAGSVVGFSADGALALVSPVANLGPPPSVVRWRDGAVVWRAPAGAAYFASLAEPDGQRLAVAVADPSAPSLPQRVDVYVVGPSGQARLLLRHVAT